MLKSDFIQFLKDNEVALNKYVLSTGKVENASVDFWTTKKGEDLIRLKSNGKPIFGVSISSLLETLNKKEVKETNYVEQTISILLQLFGACAEKIANKMDTNKGDENTEADDELEYPIGIVVLSEYEAQNLKKSNTPVYEYRKMKYTYCLLEDPEDIESAEEYRMAIKVLTKEAYDEMRMTEEDMHETAINIINNFLDDMVIENAGVSVMRSAGDMMGESNKLMDAENMQLLSEYARSLSDLNFHSVFDVDGVIGTASYLFSNEALKKISEHLGNQSFFAILLSNYDMLVLPMDEGYNDSLKKVQTLSESFEKFMDDNIFYYDKNLDFLFNTGDVMPNS